MKTYLVTGAAGFIGANFLKYILKKHQDIKVIVVDSLTYAGNLGTIKEELKDDIKMERYREFSTSARKEERSKFYSAAGIWITLFVIIFLLVYFNAINLTRYY